MNGRQWAVGRVQPAVGRNCLRLAAHGPLPSAHRRPGFTLMEVMIAIGVLALGIGGVLAIFMGAAATHRRALDETITAIAAEGAAAEVRSEFQASSFAEPRDRSSPQAAPGFPLWSYTVRTTVLEREPGGRDPGSGRPVQVYAEIVVSWQRKGERREEVYRTILFRE